MESNKKNELFLGHHQFQSLGGYLNNSFSLASVKAETWSPKVIPSITPNKLHPTNERESLR